MICKRQLKQLKLSFKQKIIPIRNRQPVPQNDATFHTAESPFRSLACISEPSYFWHESRRLGSQLIDTVKCDSHCNLVGNCVCFRAKWLLFFVSLVLYVAPVFDGRLQPVTECNSAFSVYLSIESTGHRGVFGDASPTSIKLLIGSNSAPRVTFRGRILS